MTMNKDLVEMAFIEQVDAKDYRAAAMIIAQATKAGLYTDEEAMSILKDLSTIANASRPSPERANLTKVLCQKLGVTTGFVLANLLSQYPTSQRINGLEQEYFLPDRLDIQKKCNLQEKQYQAIMNNLASKELITKQRVTKTFKMAIKIEFENVAALWVEEDLNKAQ